MANRKLYCTLAFIIFLNLAFATTVTSITAAVAGALCGVKYLIYGLLPTIALIMFMLAGLAYAAGQAFGAETKARAQNWASSLLVGGILGILLAILAPALLAIFIGNGMVMPNC